MKLVQSCFYLTLKFVVTSPCPPLGPDTYLCPTSLSPRNRTSFTFSVCP